MPRGEEFKCEEIAEIWRLKANQKTIKEIAAELGRSYGGIYKVLQRSKKYHADKRSRRCRSTNERDNRRIAEWQKGVSVQTIAQTSGLNISRSTVH